MQILGWQLVIKWMTTPCYCIIFLPVFPKQQTFLRHPIQDLRQHHGSKYSDQRLTILNAIMYYSASIIYTATLQALHGHIFFFKQIHNTYTVKSQLYKWQRVTKRFSLKVNSPVTVLHVMLHTCKSYHDSCPNWATGMIFWQINSYGMIVLQGCLTGLKPLWTVQEGINTWSKRQRGFPSSFWCLVSQ